MTPTAVVAKIAVIGNYAKSLGIFLPRQFFIAFLINNNYIPCRSIRDVRQ